jgi:seryl-tRNA synthetase
MEWLDAAVIESIRRQLTPEQIAYTVEKMAQIVERERKANKDKPRQLEAEARALQTKLDRFMSAIADGEQPKTILGEIKRLENPREQRSTAAHRSEARRALDHRHHRKVLLTRRRRRAARCGGARLVLPS